ncbi:MAG: hypothetical protein ACK5KK_09845, partial [Microbacterium sp.]
PSPTPSPTRSPTPATQPTPTEAATPTAAVILYGGSCDGLLPPPEVDQVLGDAHAVPDTVAAPHIATLGGLRCRWTGDAGVLSVLAYPAGVIDLATAEKYAAPVCESFDYDANGCRVAVDAEPAWALVTMSTATGGPWEEPPAQLSAAAEAVSVSLAAARGTRASVTDAWWRTDCPAVAAAVDLPAALGLDAYDPGFPVDGGEDVDAAIGRAAGSAIGPCQWSGFDASGAARGIQIWAYPGGADAWDAYVTALAGPTEIEVAGARAAVTAEVLGETRVVSTDGTNLLVVDTGYLDPDADPAVVVADVLAALAE